MQEQKTIKDFSILELKSIAYDEMVKLEQCQNNLKIINQELVSRSQPQIEKVEPKTEKKVVKEKNNG